MRAATKPDGYKYYEYVLIYVDDILCCSHRATEIMETMSKLYRLKVNPETGKGYEEPEIYLGAEISKYRPTDDDKEYWSLSARKYVTEAVKNVEAKLTKIGMKLNSRDQGPLPMGYKPELDISRPLEIQRGLITLDRQRHRTLVEVILYYLPP